MKKVDIIFLYEHVAREIDVVCAITANLRRMGFSVEIIHWPTGFPKALLQIEPEMVVLPFCYTEASFEAMLAYWKPSVFFNLTWEQLFYPGNLKAKTPRGVFATKHVLHHAWSKSYKDFLIQNDISPEHIFLNGQPAYTLYDEPYRDFFLSREELAKQYGLNPSSRWVLFPENYNWAFYSQATLEQFIESGQSPDDVKNMREFCNLSLKAVLEWCAKASHAGVEVILRPRPSVTSEEFHTFTKQILSEIPDRLHIIQEKSVREWILASDMVVSSHSTSLIEAAIAGKQVYILEPYAIPDALHVGWHNLLPHLKTKQEFLEVCFAQPNKTDTRLLVWARQSLMSQGDSISNLTNHLIRIVGGGDIIPKSPSRALTAPRMKFIPPARVWSVYRRVKQWLRFRKTGGIEPEFVKDALTIEVIETKITEWATFIEKKMK